MRIRIEDQVYEFDDPISMDGDMLHKLRPETIFYMAHWGGYPVDQVYKVDKLRIFGQTKTLDTICVWSRDDPDNVGTESNWMGTHPPYVVCLLSSGLHCVECKSLLPEVDYLCEECLRNES